jgi:uncharacterized protein YebE (UPF0316 family)
MNMAVFITFWVIVLARVVDVTLDTVRTVAIVQGRRIFAAVLGFFQALVYVCAIAKVLLNMDHPVYALAYALGFASGTFLGITIEQYLAFGHQLITLATRKGVEVAKVLRACDYKVAEIKGHARDGDLAILFAEIPRREAQKLIRTASAVDENCFCMVNDVRVARFGAARAALATPQPAQKS